VIKDFMNADIAHEARKVITAMPADMALDLLKAGVQCLQPEDLQTVLHSTVEDLILASLIVCIDRAEETEAKAYPGESAAGMS